ncbi:MAG: hypothetical protein KF841_03100 [Phycisphaerae bacterium]|nr:hypothetical protein [Phycisphaerae bacterium]
MKLLTNKLRRQIPPLGATEKDADPILWARFFVPGLETAYYPIEFDGINRFNGLVKALNVESMSFWLDDLENWRFSGGRRHVRDRRFRPVRLSQWKASNTCD